MILPVGGATATVSEYGFWTYIYVVHTLKG